VFLLVLKAIMALLGFSDKFVDLPLLVKNSLTNLSTELG